MTLDWQVTSWRAIVGEYTIELKRQDGEPERWVYLVFRGEACAAHGDLETLTGAEDVVTEIMAILNASAPTAAPPEGDGPH